MKTNILVLLSIKRDLSKYGQVAKIDAYYIAQIRLRVLTETEHKRYLREKADYDEQKSLATEHAAKSKRVKSTESRDPLSSTHIPKDDDDLEALAAARHIDVEDDELSDSSSIGTAKFSWCARSEFLTNDASSRSDRKFFFTFISKVLGTLRQIESSEHYQKGDDKTSAYVAGNSDKDYNCVLCGEQHKNKRGHQSQNLGLCSQFKNLKLLKEKKAVVQKHKHCFNWLGAGHSASKCKSTFSCRHCKGKHHSEL